MAENDVVVPKTFEEKLREKIKENIGDLMSNEDLKKLIDASLQTVFFSDRPNPKHNYSSFGGSEPARLPPLLHELVKELLLPSVKELLVEYFKEHPDVVKDALNNVLVLGIGQAMMQAMSMQFQGQLINFQNKVLNQIQNR